ncbi:MAG: WS/DGAT/MGAT family O-acyltransferase [Nocardioides sp.]
MVAPLDPTALGFLLAENHRMPMHVGGLQLYRLPADAGRNYVRELYESLRQPAAGPAGASAIAPLFRKHPERSTRTAGAWVWADDHDFDIDYHLRHSALPKPGRIRELFELVSRLHGTRMARERPLWEWYLIEGLQGRRIAMYTKVHHALIDGVGASRLLQAALSTDPARRDLPPPWALRANDQRKAQGKTGHSGEPASWTALRQAISITTEAAGLPGALIETIRRSVRNEASSLALYAPRTILNQPIFNARRFAAQDWPLERLRAIARSAGTQVNDVVLAMCSGAIRRYLVDADELPETSLVAMVPVALRGKRDRPTTSAGSASATENGGNAIGSVMVRLGTELPDPADRLRTVHASMADGKEALASMTPLQIQAMSALGQVPALLPSLLKVAEFTRSGVIRPAYNLVISNVPGPRSTLYYNGAELLGAYPLSIPIDGMGLNITCASYAGTMAFGLTGCRRTVPHLQVLLRHLDRELRDLERATGLTPAR